MPKARAVATKLEFEGDVGKNDFQNPQDVMNPDAAADAEEPEISRMQPM